MAAYIFDKLRELEEKNAYPLHMPGHKRNIRFMPYDFRLYDYTETECTDNLHMPEGIIADAQNALAELLGADSSFILVNGGTSGMIASILACCDPGDNVLVAANCHKSVYDGLIMAGVNPIYISPSITEEGLCGGISIRDIFRAFESYDIKAMIITSPTYEGFTCDVRTIADIVHKHGSILIVDECHGAHFVFSDVFPPSALSQGADVVVNSWHKTLPCLNQGAVLSIKGGRTDSIRIKEAVSMINTTSPSYPVMASVDYARDLLSRDKNLFSSYIQVLKDARHELAHCKTLKLVNDSIKGQSHIADVDISRFTIMVRTDITGMDLSRILLDKYNIRIEMAGLHHIVAITTVADDPKGIKRFVKAITELDKKYERKFIEKIPISGLSVSVPEMTPRDVYFSGKETVAYEEAPGRIAAASIIPYPPGIPLVPMGKIITGENIESIRQLKAVGISVIGAENGSVAVVKKADK